MNAIYIMDALSNIAPEKVQSALERMGYIDKTAKTAHSARQRVRLVLLAAVLALLLAACGYAVVRAVNSPEQAWEITQQEISKMKDMGILADSLRLPKEYNYIMENPENDGHMPESNYWYGRIFKHSYCVMATDEDYLFSLFVDTMSGKITKLSIEARADEDDEHAFDELTSLDLSMNYYEIIPKDITLDKFCSLLNEYWGFNGYTLASTVEETFYHYNTEIPDGRKLLSDYANAPYLTVFFDGDQEGVPMYIQLYSYAHPSGVYFTVGTNHAIG